MARAGRPSKYDPAFAEQARKLAQLGATDREAADFFGVAESTLSLWKLVHPEFSEALKVGKEHADARVIQSLYRRAVGYSFDSEKVAINAQGDITRAKIVEHVPPDTTAQIFWLKNRSPEDWRDVQHHKHEAASADPLMPEKEWNEQFAPSEPRNLQ